MYVLAYEFMEDFWLLNIYLKEKEKFLRKKMLCLTGKKKNGFDCLKEVLLKSFQK